jgi:hypothetical protein
LSTLKGYADEEEQEEKKRERRKEKKKKDQGVLTDLTFYGHQQIEEVRKFRLICYRPKYFFCLLHGRFISQ